MSYALHILESNDGDKFTITSFANKITEEIQVKNTSYNLVFNYYLYKT